jgi:phosphohistidine phosphatase
MKTLVLLRHAKTERDSSTGRDFDRALTDRGRQDAEKIGARVRERELAFDLVLASPARRSAETVECAGLHSPRFDERIYDASSMQLLGIVQQARDEVDRLMMVGHNPGFERLASQLTGADIEMPTGALVEIELPVARWHDAEAGCGRLVRFLKPKELA